MKYIYKKLEIISEALINIKHHAHFFGMNKKTYVDLTEQQTIGHRTTSLGIVPWGYFSGGLDRGVHSHFS